MNSAENQICQELWLENEPQLRRICKLKLASSPDDIEDVISETFLALCKRISENGVPDKPKGWLYATMNNLINLKYREIYKYKEREKSLSDEEFELPIASDDIGEKTDEIYNDEIKDRLKELLTEDEYQIIYRIYFSGLKMKEIARLHNSTESAVKQKHYRICRKLRKAMADSRKLF